MSDDGEIQRLTEIERVANGKPSHFQMDAAFRARMHAAIAAGLESAPIGVITTPGTKNPKYVPTEPSPPVLLAGWYGVLVQFRAVRTRGELKGSALRTIFERLRFTGRLDT
jgi:hypothetical protein